MVQLFIFSNKKNLDRLLCEVNIANSQMQEEQ